MSPSPAKTLLAAIATSGVCGTRGSDTLRGSSTQEIVLSGTEALTANGHDGSDEPLTRIRFACHVTLSGEIASHVTSLSTTVWPTSVGQLGSAWEAKSSTN